MSYRPICDIWLLARPKVAYYGAYPAGFLGRARDLLGVTPTSYVLHVCGGKVRDYPYRGLSQNDYTMDLDQDLKPDFCQDVREHWPHIPLLKQTLACSRNRRENEQCQDGSTLD